MPDLIETAPFSGLLADATRAERDALHARPFVRAALAGRVALPTYTAFLGQAYHHVRHTVPLLMATGAALPDRLGWLQHGLATYIAEEQGHDEWILQDIEAAGGDPAAVRRSRADLPCELMVAYAWDVVRRGNPVGFFGMVAVLEGTSVHAATRAARAMQARLGLPDEAFRYLLSHGELDHEHVGFFAGLMDRLDEPDDRAAVVHVARVMYRLYGDVLDGLPLQLLPAVTEGGAP